MQVALKSSVVRRLFSLFGLVFGCAGLALVSACGQKGPLVLPAPAKAASAASPAAPR